jgi:beta-lactamase superfamily II metal-dependent hydrolase
MSCLSPTLHKTMREGKVEIRIFDVTHGFCAYVVGDNGNVMLMDCGSDQDSGFRPSTYLRNAGCTGIEIFIVTNFDGDHLSDLPNLRSELPIDFLYLNPSISADQLRRLKLKAGPLRSGTQALLEMMSSYTATSADPPDFPGVELGMFWNDYPAFEDTNNLSFVTFLHYRDVHVVFPGDLETAGWRALLRNQSFRDNLRRVNFFVASHHGRENGYCPEVFDYCNPDIVIVSDGPVRYETQNTDYGRHAKGVQFGDRLRSVLTTRKDGMITIWQRAEDDGPYIDKAR